MVGAVHRTVIVSTFDDNNPVETEPDILAPLERAYGAASQSAAKKYKFSRQFRGPLPSDMVHEGYSNHAVVSASNSPLGRCVMYVERMPGPSRPQEILDAASRTVDLASRALQAYFDSRPELHDRPEARRKIREFLQTELPADARNTTLLFQSMFRITERMEESKVEEHPDFMAEGLRLTLFLVERGYIQPGDVAVALPDIWNVALRGLLRKLQRAAGDASNGPVSSLMSKLEDPEAMAQAFNDGLSRIGVTREEFDKSLEGVVRVLADPTSVEVTWECDMPVQTNGEWDPQGKSLSWKSRGVAQPLWPAMLFAVWAEPESQFQMGHFGRIVLRDKLHEYNAWYAALSPPDREVWDRFMESLRPGADLQARLEGFQFPGTLSTTAPSTQPASQNAVEGARLLLEGLGGRS